MLSEPLIGVGWIVLSSQIGLLAPIRVTENSTVSGSALAACHRVTHGIVILANCPPPTSPLGTAGALKVPQTPRASSAPLRRCTPCWALPGPPPSVTAGIASAVASGRSPSAKRPTHPKRSCFTGPDREATALTARGGHVVFRQAPPRGAYCQDSGPLARPDPSRLLAGIERKS